MGVGLLALAMSMLIRLQLGFPGTFAFIDPAVYIQLVTMHGMIMVIYLLTALFLGGFGNYLIPLMVGARDMVFPYVNMLSFWVYFVAVLILIASMFVPGGSTGAGWTLYPPQAILPGTPGGSDWGIILMLISLALFIVGFTMGGLNYVVTVLQARTRGMTLMRMPLTVWGIFMATVLALLAFPALLRRCDHDVAGQNHRHQLFHARHRLDWDSNWTTSAAARSCFSTCSGFSVIPRSTSSPCRPLASFLTCSLSMPGKISLATA